MYEGKTSGVVMNTLLEELCRLIKKDHHEKFPYTEEYEGELERFLVDQFASDLFRVVQEFRKGRV